jgi:hypothetical protein
MIRPSTFVFSEPGKEIGERRQLAFADPVMQWVAPRTTDLRASFERVAQLQSEGYYVAMVLSYEAARGLIMRSFVTSPDRYRSRGLLCLRIHRHSAL